MTEATPLKWVSFAELGDLCLNHGINVPDTPDAESKKALSLPAESSQLAIMTSVAVRLNSVLDAIAQTAIDSRISAIRKEEAKHARSWVDTLEAATGPMCDDLKGFVRRECAATVSNVQHGKYWCHYCGWAPDAGTKERKLWDAWKRKAAKERKAKK